MKIDMVMFDMDGTFVDSRPYHAMVFYKFLNKYFRKTSVEEGFACLGHSANETLGRAGVPIEDHERLIDHLVPFYIEDGKEYVPLTKVPEGFEAVINFLKENSILKGVVTNSFEGVVKDLMDHHDLWKCFDFVSGADRECKDKVTRCNELLARYSVKPENVLFVGDTESDMELGKTMGFIKCFAKTEIAWYKDEEYIMKELQPEYVINGFPELLEILKRVV